MAGLPPTWSPADIVKTFLLFSFASFCKSFNAPDKLAIPPPYLVSSICPCKSLKVNNSKSIVSLLFSLLSVETSDSTSRVSFSVLSTCSSIANITLIFCIINAPAIATAAIFLPFLLIIFPPPIIITFCMSYFCYLYILFIFICHIITYIFHFLYIYYIFYRIILIIFSFRLYKV